MRKWISGAIGLLIVLGFTLAGTAQLIAQDETPTPTIRESVILTATAFVQEDTPPDPAGTPIPPTDDAGEDRSSEDFADARLIQVGEPVRDELGSERTSVQYSFRASAGTVYDIDVLSTDFDTFLRLYAADGTLIEENDDGGSLTDSRIASFQATDNAAYIIEVTSFGAAQGTVAESGAFTLEVNSLELSLLSFDQEVEANLTEFSAEHVFRGEAGETVMIYVESDAFDPYAILLFDGFELDADDDSGGSLNPRIGPYELADDGLYTVQVEAFSDGDGGPYTIRVERVQSIAATLGEPLTVEPSDSATTVITFEGTSNMLIDVMVEGAETEYTLLDPFGFEVAYGSTFDDFSTQIESQLLYDNGTHTLVIDQGISPGTLTVTINTADIPKLTLGSNTVEFGDGFEQYAELEVQEGDQVRITILPDDPDLYWDVTLEVQVNGQYVARLSGYGGDDLTLTMTFEDSGTALLQMLSYGDVTTFDVMLEAIDE